MVLIEGFCNTCNVNIRVRVGDAIRCSECGKIVEPVTVQNQFTSGNIQVAQLLSGKLGVVTKTSLLTTTKLGRVEPVIVSNIAATTQVIGQAEAVR
jgi:hypothetical protein